MQTIQTEVFILVDSCPVLPVADSLLVAQHVDGVIFTLLREVSRLPQVYSGYQRLSALGCLAESRPRSRASTPARPRS